MRCRSLLPAAACAVLVAACGGGHDSGGHAPRSVTVTQAASHGGRRTFSAPGMSIHFKYPAGFRAATLSAQSKTTGGGAKGSITAIGIGKADLIVVYENPLGFTVTTRNMPAVKRRLDQDVGASAGRAVSGTIGIVGGFPALAYAPVPVHLPGQPAGVMNEIHAVFIGRSEYELECQSTPKRRARIRAACREMLRTLSG